MTDNWLETWRSLVVLVGDAVSRFTYIDLSQVSYPDSDWAMKLGLTIFALFVLKLIGTRMIRSKHSRRHSGHEISRSERRGFISRILFLVPKLIGLTALGVALIAIANPLLNYRQTKTEIVKSRIRVDLKDISLSMEAGFVGSNISKAQVAFESHVQFLKMRQGKGDRTSFWLFSDNPHLVEDFIVDDDLYFWQVYDAPWVTGYDQQTLDNFFTINPNYYIPKERFVPIFRESGTNIADALKAIIKQFDNDPVSQKAKDKSILIITDAEVAMFPQDELEGLRQRKIVPYIIWIETSLNSYIPDFISRINEYGGFYFDIQDKGSLDRAYKAIDKMEATEVKVERKLVKINVFQIFLAISVLIVLVAVFTGLLAEIFLGTYP